MIAKGLTAVPYEKLNDATYQNLMHYAGFCYACLLLVKSRVGSGSNSAPVCSTWVWISRGTTKRRPWQPLGDPTIENVANANTMISR
eukprot:5042155-Pyramimonas_sp.AAC.1